MTSTTSAAASNSVSRTASVDCAMKRVEFHMIRYSSPGGNALAASCISRSRLMPVSSALVPGRWKMAIMIEGLPDR